MPPSKQNDGASVQALSSRADLATLDIAADRLNGAGAIAAFRGEPLHRTRYLIRIGAIPVAREGERIVASKRALLEHWRKATSGEAA